MRSLSPEEQALWQKVVASVRPFHEPAQNALPPAEPEVPAPAPTQPRRAPAARPQQSLKPAPGTTLDGSWDKRLTRGTIQPDATLDLHGHNLATAHALLDDRLEQAIGQGARVLLLVTGKPPTDPSRPVGRGAIRAAVGDWLAASRHAPRIAAVRNAHPRHGGSGALYIVLRRER